MNPIQVPDGGGKKVNIFGIPMVIRIHGRDTGGVVSAVESHDVPGGGPPPRIHQREDETFQVLEGEYEWTVSDKKFVARKGETIFAPRGLPHTYRYLGQTPGRLMCVITPAGFEGFFEEIGALSPQQQQDTPRVMEIEKNSGWKSSRCRASDAGTSGGNALWSHGTCFPYQTARNRWGPSRTVLKWQGRRAAV